MCKDDSQLYPDQQALNLNPTPERWAALITNKMYTLSLAMKSSPTLKFNMFVIGKEMPNDASNLPMTVSNSIVTPLEDVLVVAGEGF
jgi:hypothetical protein